MLSNTSDKEFLKEWRERIGEKQADFITKQSCEIGTRIHDVFEKYLKQTPDHLNGLDPLEKWMFRGAKVHLDKISKIFAQEKALHSKILKLAGRVDCVALYEGIPSIIDFKTSKRAKSIEWITDYFLQCSIYSYMIEEMFGVKIKQLVVIIANRDGTCDVFKSTRSKHRSLLIKRITTFREKICQITKN